MIEPTSTIGRYQVQRLLGQGAMGTVYLALDPLLKRPVAVKVVTAPRAESAAALERFRREAEISARLNHPNIVTVYDVGTDPLHGPFLAMEFVEGSSLSRLIREGLPVESGLRLMVQGLGALAAAEAAGVVHRDIKPANILISADGRFKLMDFGIARADEPQLTQAGMIFGTPCYTAPELFTGSEASAVTDRYAFVITVFEVLTGKQPFQGSSVGATLYRIVHEPPTLPEELPPYAADVFRKALAKNPAQRYQDLRAFLADLVEALDLSAETRLKLLASIHGDAPFGVTQRLGEMTLPMRVPLEAPEATRPMPLAESPKGLETPTPPLPTPRFVLGFSRTWALGGAVALILAGLGLGWRAWSLAQPTRAAVTPVEVTSDPDGADVTVNGALRGRAPLRLDLRPEEAAQITVSREGYLSRTVVLEPGQGALFLRLEAKAGVTVDVLSDPEGAEVLLDGEPRGRTPLRGLVIPAGGRPVLTLRHAGFEPWSAPIDRDEPFPEIIRMQPRARR